MEGLEIFKLFGSIYIQDADVMKKLDGVEKKASGVSGKLEGMIKGVEKWGKALMGSFVIKQVYDFVKGVSDAAGQINDMSERTGIGTERLQELKFAAEQTGVSFETITGSMTKLTKNMGKADDESKAMTEAFRQLGIKIEDNNGKLKPANEIFDLTINKLADMGDKTERNILGNKIFGNGFTELIPLLNGGSSSIKQLSEKAHELGLVINDEAIKSGDEFGDTLNALVSSGKAIFSQFALKVMPMLTDFSTFVLDNMPEIVSILEGLTVVWVAQKSVLAVLWANKKLNMIADGLVALETAAATKGTLAYTIAQKANAVATGISSAINFVFGTSLQFTGKQLIIVAGIIMLVVGLLLLLTKGFSSADAEIKKTVDSANTLKNLQASEVNYQYQQSMPGLANGGTVLSAGRVLVGERGPEILDLPKNAKVTPLDRTGEGIYIENMNFHADDVEDIIIMKQFFTKVRQVARQGV